MAKTLLTLRVSRVKKGVRLFLCTLWNGNVVLFSTEKDEIMRIYDKIYTLRTRPFGLSLTFVQVGDIMVAETFLPAN